MSGFKNAEGKPIVDRMIVVIHENRARLSEIDGAIGDGDHGINMDKGFTLAEQEMAGRQVSFSDALKTLGRTLVMKIGGSMGPLYGSMFKSMARAAKETRFLCPPRPRVESQMRRILTTRMASGT